MIWYRLPLLILPLKSSTSLLLGRLRPKAAFLDSSMECFRLPLCKDRHLHTQKLGTPKFVINRILFGYVWWLHKKQMTGVCSSNKLLYLCNLNERFDLQISFVPFLMCTSSWANFSCQTSPRYVFVQLELLLIFLLGQFVTWWIGWKSHWPTSAEGTKP